MLCSNHLKDIYILLIILKLAVEHNDDFRLHAVLLHAQAAIVEFYDWLLYEVSPSAPRAASVVGEPKRQRGAPALPTTNLKLRIKHYATTILGIQ